MPATVNYRRSTFPRSQRMDPLLSSYIICVNMDKDKTPTPSSQSAAKYRGAAVMVRRFLLACRRLLERSALVHHANDKDLQLPPAFCLGPEDELSRAIEAAYEREFDQLP